MRPVSVFEVYTIIISYSLFIEIKENLMTVEKMYCNESQKSLS